MNPAELINDLLKRSDGSLDQLKLHYGPLIRYVIAPILPDARDREEVFSDILVRVWDRVGQFDPAHGTWSNWLSTIARAQRRSLLSMVPRKERLKEGCIE